jgi:hypothetical protein
MRANDDAGSERNEARLDDDAANFVYTGQENVPDGVIHVRVHPSIKVICAKAFFRQSRLINVELHDVIEVIEWEAFRDCRSLREILFPPSVRSIKYYVFHRCSVLTTAILNNGLEVIEYEAFSYCTSLRKILFPLSVRVIEDWAFHNCSGLTTAILNDGLEEIGEGAFRGCALVRINIPHTIREIDEMAFEDCSNLLTVRFCDEIEEFVSGESMRHWWNNGVHEKCLSMYCLLVRFNIPERLGLVRATQWLDSIHGMLTRIPFISKNGMDSYFRSIDSKLSAYEGSTMLELAI